jgi:hypothetical protein
VAVHPDLALPHAAHVQGHRSLPAQQSRPAEISIKNRDVKFSGKGHGMGVVSMWMVTLCHVRTAGAAALDGQACGD